MLEREKYDRFRVAPLDPATLRCRDVERILKQVAQSSDSRLTIEKFAESVEGRPIYLAKIGTGPKEILLWSQMHGDEPTHTAVLLDLASYLLKKPAEPESNDILSKCTLNFIPMLNPDGAEAVKRYNAQGIDINRDRDGSRLLRVAPCEKPSKRSNPSSDSICTINTPARASVARQNRQPYQCWPPRPIQAAMTRRVGTARS